MLFCTFHTLAKNGGISPLIISHFQVPKIVFFRKLCKENTIFHHLRNFTPSSFCKMFVIMLKYRHLPIVIFSQMFFHDSPLQIQHKN